MDPLHQPAPDDRDDLSDRFLFVEGGQRDGDPEPLLLLLRDERSEVRELRAGERVLDEPFVHKLADRGAALDAVGGQRDRGPEHARGDRRARADHDRGLRVRDDPKPDRTDRLWPAARAEDDEVVALHLAGDDRLGLADPCEELIDAVVERGLTDELVQRRIRAARRAVAWNDVQERDRPVARAGQ